MSVNYFDQFRQKMETAGVMESSIRSFQRNYELLRGGSSGMIAESEIDPAQDLPVYERGGEDFDPALLAQTVVIKLNGGLGTSMGLKKVKSLLEVRPGVSFLDLIVRQIVSLREQSKTSVRLLLMNSFTTSRDTLDYLAGCAPEGLRQREEVELMQNMAPKVVAESLKPAVWPENPDLEWCPPGHGDLYPALLGSGWLEKLLSQGVRYAFVSNSDNLGAVLEPELLRFFAESGSPFLMEVTRRTTSDRKGGHLARRRSDGRLLLREVAQCPEEDIDSFQDITRHRYFNTNSLWLQLEALKEVLAANDGVLPLPVIQNRKTIDPRDASSTPVIQLETAMGAALECFEGAQAIEVGRERFTPVKKTSDLLALRSDAYKVSEEGRVSLAPECNGIPPEIELDDCYKFVDALNGLGVPSLIECESLNVQGKVRFEKGVILKGKVEFKGNDEEERVIESGVYGE